MDMMLEQFKIIFDRPEKVRKLRGMILNLAVRGKLVEQDPNDEPASVLIERIKEEKERLVREKKIKKEKPLAEVSDEEKPYELPNGWNWTRLGSIGITQTGTTPSTRNSEFFNGNIPFIKPGDINELGINYSNESLTELGLEKGRLIEKNSVMMVCIGGSIGKNYYIDRDCSCNQQINSITPLAGIDAKFIHYLVSGTEFYNNVIDNATGSATPIINKSKWELITIQLPPLEEQKRIVEKVDSLMAFCDKLEKSLEKKVHYGLVSAKSVFNSIGNVTTTEELEETLRFILSNFKDLSLGDNAVKELKNCILQLAVQGKLVPQDPSDETAEVLLERIQEEKEKLIKDKTINKEKTLGEIGEEEKPWILNGNWVWSRILDVAFIQTGSTPPTANKEFYVGNIPFLNPGNIKNGCISYVGKTINEDAIKYSRLISEKSILVTSINGSLENGIGRCWYTDREVACNQQINAITPIKAYYKYINYALLSPSIQYSIKKNATGTVNFIINKNRLSNIVIPIPPLAEQKRIVEKVDSLMQLCEELEKKIEKSKDYSNRLMESILKNSF